MVTRPSWMFYCQHLLGIGHLVRSVQIVRSLAKEFRVLLALGGAKPQCRFQPVQNGRPDLINEYVADCRRFHKEMDSAWRNYVEE